MTDITLEAQKMAVTRAIEAHSMGKAALFAHDGKTPQAPDLPQFSEQLRELGVIGPRAGLAPKQAKRADDAANLKRWAGAQLGYVRTGKKGTGQPMGL